MFNYHHMNCCRYLVLAILVVCSIIRINSESINASASTTFTPAVATWYGSPTGAGSGGACGFADDVGFPPYNGFISAGNNVLFKSGKGCGSCYQVKCTQHSACSGRPITVTITDECPGACNNDAVHFDLSGKAFGSLAKFGQENALRQAGRINIQVKCGYKVGLTFKIDVGSNQNYLAFAVEDENGDGDVGGVEILGSNSGAQWVSMGQSWGATWKAELANGARGPYSVRLTSIESGEKVLANKVIPANWAPGQRYRSRVNFH
ncbi:expansin B2 [Striga asiatica]|uniref:Expansin B2 n=1 Tax=Striga asiatica TaxID=4170 RepID=A0A5A7P8E6_STRAF|nr:expansin B2 [Striga asiatica]